MNLENEKDTTNVLLVVQDEYSDIVLNAIHNVLNNSNLLSKMNLDKWKNTPLKNLDVQVEAQYDEDKKESLVTLRLIRTTTKRRKEYTQVKEVCCLVKDDNITVLQRADYVNRVEGLPQAKAKFCEIKYNKKALLGDTKVEKNVDRKKEVGKMVQQNRKVPVKGLITQEIPVQVNMLIYANDNKKKFVIDAINKLLKEKTVINKQGGLANIDKILVRNIPGIGSIKKIEATYDSKKDRCFIKVTDNDKKVESMYYVIGKKGIVNLDKDNYDYKMKKVNNDIKMPMKYGATHIIDSKSNKMKMGNLRSLSAKSQTEEVKENSKSEFNYNPNKETIFMRLYNNIHKLKVRFIKDAIYKVARIIGSVIKSSKKKQIDKNDIAPSWANKELTNERARNLGKRRISITEEDRVLGKSIKKIRRNETEAQNITGEAKSFLRGNINVGQEKTDDKLGKRRISLTEEESERFLRSGNIAKKRRTGGRLVD